MDRGNGPGRLVRLHELGDVPVSVDGEDVPHTGPEWLHPGPMRVRSCAGYCRRVVAGLWRRICGRAGSVHSVVLAGALLATSACGFVGPGGGGIDHAVVSDIDPRTATLTLSKTADGGAEVVVARDADDAAEIQRVRAFLHEQAAQFRQGRYQDPAKEHGMVMPGSRELEAGYASVRVDYADLPAGGRITYVANDPALVDALHAWFDRRDSSR